jgi:hypothetical protein
MTSNNSSNKIHNGDSRSFYNGDIHLSQYKDLNDDLTPSDDLNNSAKELFNQDYEGTLEEDFAPKKTCLIRSNHTFNNDSNQNNDECYDSAGHTKTFRTANNNDIDSSTVSLIPEKQNTPSVLKKFQAHPPKSQPPTNTPINDKRHNTNKQDNPETLSTPIRQDLPDLDDNIKD